MIPRLRIPPSCYDSAMRHLLVLFIHFVATLAQLLGPGGVRSIVAESFHLEPLIDKSGQVCALKSAKQLQCKSI